MVYTSLASTLALAKGKVDLLIIKRGMKNGFKAGIPEG